MYLIDSSSGTWIYNTTSHIGVFSWHFPFPSLNLSRLMIHLDNAYDNLFWPLRVFVIVLCCLNINLSLKKYYCLNLLRRRVSIRSYSPVKFITDPCPKPVWIPGQLHSVTRLFSLILQPHHVWLQCAKQLLISTLQELALKYTRNCPAMAEQKRDHRQKLTKWNEKALVCIQPEVGTAQGLLRERWLVPQYKRRAF